MDAPELIDGFRVIEFGFFAESILPAGYVPHPDGRPPLEPVRNVAIATAEGVDGYYLLFCTADWRYVTWCFYEMLESLKRSPLVEFGQDVLRWHVRAS